MYVCIYVYIYMYIQELVKYVHIYTIYSYLFIRPDTCCSFRCWEISHDHPQGDVHPSRSPKRYGDKVVLHS